MHQVAFAQDLNAFVGKDFTVSQYYWYISQPRMLMYDPSSTLMQTPLFRNLHHLLGGCFFAGLATIASAPGYQKRNGMTAEGKGGPELLSSIGGASG